MEHYTEHLTTGIAISKHEVTAATIKAATKRKRTSYENQDIPWTASRCNRLLRTITSRISILQKLASSNRLPTQDRTVSTKHYDSRAHQASEGRHGPLSNITSPSKDPEWLPDAYQTARYVSETYTGKSKSKQRGATRKKQPLDSRKPGMGLATPFVKRMLRPESASQIEKPPTDSRARPQNGKKRRKLAIKPNSLAEEACANLISALENFLTATKPDAPEPRTGASSLVSTCLRKVPAYISYENEALANEEDEDAGESPDAADEIYMELEDLGPDGHSWSGLREVVRAHGVHKILAAMQAGLLPSTVIDSLISVCGRCNAMQEGQDLVRARLAEAKKAEQDGALEQVSTFAGLYQCDTFLMRTLRLSLGNMSLSLSQLCVNQSLWSRILRSMMRAGEASEATALLCDCVEMAWRTTVRVNDVEQKQIQETFERTAALLTGIASTQHAAESGSWSPPTSIARALQDLGAMITRAITTGSPQQSNSPHSRDDKLTLIVPLLLSSLVLALQDAGDTGETVRPSIEEILALLHHAKDSRQDLRSKALGDDFICQVALCIRRWDEEAGDDFLRETCQQLLDTATTVDAVQAKLLKGLASNNAAAYAEARNDKASLIIAEEVEDLLLQGISPLKARTPQVKARDKVDKYRWEDGLCEWVMKTPMVSATTKREGFVTGASLLRSLSFPGVDRTRDKENQAAASEPLAKVALVSSLEARKALSEVPNAPGSHAFACSDEPEPPPRAGIKRPRSQPREAQSEVCSEDDLDELALSTRKRKCVPLPQPKIRKAANRSSSSGKSGKPVKRILQRSSSSFRQSSDSSAWETVGVSDDELGM